jgi:hypothetical protein
MEQQCLDLFSSFSISELRILVQGILPGPHYWNRCKKDILDHIFQVATPEVLNVLFRKATGMSHSLGQDSASVNGALKRKRAGDHSEEDREVGVGCFSRIMLTH